jgi:hypothetical protein
MLLRHNWSICGIHVRTLRSGCVEHHLLSLHCHVHSEQMEQRCGGWAKVHVFDFLAVGRSGPQVQPHTTLCPLLPLPSCICMHI